MAWTSLEWAFFASGFGGLYHSREHIHSTFTGAIATHTISLTQFTGIGRDVTRSPILSDFFHGKEALYPLELCREIHWKLMIPGLLWFTLVAGLKYHPTLMVELITNHFKLKGFLGWYVFRARRDVRILYEVLERVYGCYE